jgi:hypothetical protein
MVGGLQCPQQQQQQQQQVVRCLSLLIVVWL